MSKHSPLWETQEAVLSECREVERKFSEGETDVRVGRISSGTGTGKTRVVLSLCVGSGKSLIVVTTPSMVDHWKDEMKEVSDSPMDFLGYGDITSPKKHEGGVFISTYDVVDQHRDALSKWGFTRVVYDEIKSIQQMGGTTGEPVDCKFLWLVGAKCVDFKAPPNGFGGASVSLSSGEYTDVGLSCTAYLSRDPLEESLRLYLSDSGNRSSRGLDRLDSCFDREELVGAALKEIATSKEICDSIRSSVYEMKRYNVKTALKESDAVREESARGPIETALSGSRGFGKPEITDHVMSTFSSEKVLFYCRNPSVAASREWIKVYSDAGSAREWLGMEGKRGLLITDASVISGTCLPEVTDVVFLHLPKNLVEEVQVIGRARRPGQRSGKVGVHYVLNSSEVEKHRSTRLAEWSDTDIDGFSVRVARYSSK